MWDLTLSLTSGLHKLFDPYLVLDFTIRRGPKPASIAKISEARSLAVVSAIVDKL